MDEIDQTFNMMPKKRKYAHRPPRLRQVAVLTPITGSVTQAIMIDDAETLIGRGAEATSIIDDASVSRQHARITHSESEYIIEDLDSHNGTYVDGVPIVSCILRNGDSVQIGQNLFYFDRALLPDDEVDGAAP